MKVLKTFVTLLCAFAVTAVQASQGFNAQVTDCASLLPAGKKYQVSIDYDIDTRMEKIAVNGSFSIDWAPEYMPSEQEQEKAFKQLGPFIECVGPSLAGKQAD
ncbi:hypothetical protein [Psychromonas ossibalaenae]|uniref:hypothetical protein n=1 Tax=Psychromonas ossibalaenae TaxID=444922 RepID=UPI00035ED579|nr:hypothetical protein [Psychromonas ossibalaenae]